MNIFDVRKTVMAFVSLLAITCALYMDLASASGNSKEEIDLIGNASGYDKSKESLYQTSQDQLEKLQAAGIISKDVTRRFDYVSYYRPKRSVFFHDSKLLYFEYEYMDEFIGCCVNEGFGLILQGKPGDEAMNFAVDNGCEINDGRQIYLPPNIEKELKTRGVEIGSVFELSCRTGNAQ